MTEAPRPAGPTMVPYFGYRDAAALRWLAGAFGFEERQAYAAPDGTVMHAEMAFGGGGLKGGLSAEYAACRIL